MESGGAVYSELVTEDLPADLQAALSERYELRRLVGRGGMASVYLAHDRKHQREVAIKVLLPYLAASLGTDRFLNEIQIVARLNHPHILGLFDSGQAGGFLYYVMPFVDGGSLRQRLSNGQRLDLAAALAIAEPVADSLGYAHRMHVLHRDIKPENILFSQGHPIVADFGIAKAISTAAGDVNLTRTGFPLGTPGYMSPEQAAGLTDLDERTDVYSLGVVVYEMLVGEIPGRWPTEESVRTGRFFEVAASHRPRLTALGSRVEAALARALAIRHDQRTATPRALLEELSGAAVAPRRRYSEGEVEEIVKRASEIEATTPSAGGTMTIGGVEALAAEVGIAPDVVRSAARSVAGSEPLAAAPKSPIASQPYNRLLGGSTRLIYERVVEGEITESDFPALVDELRRLTGNVGQASALGHSLSWSLARGGGARRDLEVVVSSRRGLTRIVAQENFGPLIGAVYGPIGGGMGGGGMGLISAIVAASGHPAFMALMFPVWLGITYTTARTTFHRLYTRRARDLATLTDDMAALTRELIAERPRLPGAP
jgi:serine/threonine protein kinase/uncharacterized membrane protein